MQPTEQLKNNQSDFLEYQEFLEFKAFKDKGGSVANLTYPSPDNTLDKVDYYHQLSGEGLPMAGTIRTDEKCLKCKGKLEYSEKYRDLICPDHFTRPKKYYLDLHYKAPKKKGIRLKIRRDRSGKLLDSYARCQFEASLIALEIEEKNFNPARYANNNYKKYIFDEVVNRWLLRAKSGMAQGTYKLCEIFIRLHHLPQFSGNDIRDIKKDDILDYRHKLREKELCQDYINNILTSLKRILFDATDWELLETMPKFPKLPTEKKLSPQWIDAGIQNKILENIPSYHRPIFQFMFLTGCRPGEATGLMWDCIDFDKRLITVRRTFSDGELMHRTKTKTPRYLPMTDELYSLLSKQKKGLGFVFTFKGTHYKRIRVMWLRAAKKTGYDIPLKNATRHSFGSQRLNEGFSYEEIGAALGHQNIKITQSVYTEFQAAKLLPLMEGKKKVVQINRPETVQN